MHIVALKALTRLPGAPRTPHVSIRPRYLTFPVKFRLSTSDWATLDKVLLQKEYEETSARHATQLRRYYDRCLGEGLTPIIVDCGANIGLSSVWYAYCFPSAKVVALEPVRENFDLLVRNTSPYENIIPIRAAVSSKDQILRLENNDAHQAPNAWQTTPDGPGEIVDVVTIDEVTRNVAGGVLFIVKIDIEGHERALFGEQTDWVARTPLVAIELHDWHLPWQGCGHVVLGSLARSGARDYIQSGENMLSYSRELLL